jgi:hypothetical protein
MELLSTELDDGGIEVAFNYAMAAWGRARNASVEQFRRVVELFEASVRERSDPNFHQCMAVAYFVIGGDSQAHEQLRLSEATLRNNPARTFSCWRYLTILPAEFRKDLGEIRQMLKGEPVKPAVIAGASVDEPALI